MTQASRFWDGTVLGDATTAPYDAANEMARVLQSVSGGGGIATNQGGVFRGELNELAVTGAATPVSINSGRGISAGAWYENDAATTIAIPTPAVSTRVDVIVMRKDWAAQTIRLVRVAGTEGAGVPAITQLYGTTWDTPLANASITTGGVITLTDRREFLGSTLFRNLRVISVGGIPYGTTTTAYADLPIGAANTVLTSSGTAPQWSTSLNLAGTLTTGDVVTMSKATDGTLSNFFNNTSAGANAAISIGVRNNLTSQTVLRMWSSAFAGTRGGLNRADLSNITGDGAAGLLIDTGGVAGSSIVLATGSAITGRLIITSAGLIGINQTTDTFMTQGIVIQQGGNDNEIIAVKSTDVAHGMTSRAETDTYGTFGKVASDGGLQIEGLGAANGPGAILVGSANSPGNVTAKSTAARAYVELVAGLKSGTTITAPSIGQNSVAFRNGDGNARFIFQTDGTSYEDVGTAWTNYDDHDDVALLTDLSIAASRAGDAIHSRFASFLRYSPAMLQAMDLMHFNADGHHFANRSKIQMALIGASRQLGERIAALEQANRELRELLGVV
jgi:hypothetical protein